MLTHDEVVWGYRYILGREPESADVIASTAAAVEDVQTFRSILLRSPEFEGLSLQIQLSGFQQSIWVAAPVFSGTRLMWVDLRDRFVSFGCLQDDYEVVESRFIRGVLREGDVFVDVGANIGWYTMLASTIVGESGYIHAFEPRRPIVDYLQKTIAMNGLEKLITVHPIGLSSAAKSEILMWDAASDNGGGASFARDDASTEMVCQPIEVRSLDSLGLDHVDVMKIDVEGAELLVVEGAARLLERDRPIVMTEVLPSQLERVSGCPPQRYFDFFASRGYHGYIVDPNRCGERVFGFPSSWEKELVNIGFIPDGRPVDPSVFGN